MTTLSREQIATRLQHLPSLPQAVSELLSSFADENVDIDRIARLISHDQALAARILRVANSSFYGLQHKVSTIQEAVVLLGFRAVRSMALAVGMHGTFNTESCRSFDSRAYHRHCTAVGVTARNLAAMAGINRDLAFTAGLLHDIGRLALAANFAVEYSEVLAYQRRHDCFLVVAERDVLGIDHAEIGGMLAKAWHFPEALHSAVVDHHAAAAAKADSLANLVHVADVTAHALGLENSGNEAVMPLDKTAWGRLGGDWLSLARSLPQIQQDFAEANQTITA